jgi:YjbE family integral membrane protein
MELFTSQWWSALLVILVIDLVLAGDNAIVIALAARNMPQHLKTRTIVWGTLGAIAVRLAMALGVVWLLDIPGLMMVGGLGLVWVAYQLLADDVTESSGDPVAHTFRGAMNTIIVANALMGMGNVLGVAGAAHGSFSLLVIGLLLSVPIVVFGSALVLKLVTRFPLVVQIGGAVLALTAAKMIVSDPLLKGIFGAFHGDVVSEPLQAVARWVVYVLVIGGVLIAGWWKKRGAQASFQLGG